MMRADYHNVLTQQKTDADGLFRFLEGLREEWGPAEPSFLCIGTDRSTGDALGPLTGSFLEEFGFSRVIGTLKAPCDSNNISLRLNELLEAAEDHKMLAIDACLGQEEAIGWFLINKQPLQPGKALGKNLPSVGDASIKGVVNRKGPKVYTTLQHTSLYTVMEMAKQISTAIDTIFPLEHRSRNI
jgi:putative sporulation protein YyaC